MRTVNRFTIHGNINTLTSFDRALKISVATHRTFIDANGAERKETDWNTLTVLNEAQINYLRTSAKKGDVVYAEGYLKQTEYERQGQKIYSTDLITNVVNIFSRQPAA